MTLREVLSVSEVDKVLPQARSREVVCQFPLPRPGDIPRPAATYQVVFFLLCMPHAYPPFL